MTMVPGDYVDVCPMEDAILAFLEYLVDPKLPVATSGGKVNPSLDEQESVAKQVHAVVILYNYYLRKQHRQLEFLSFERFCKLSVNLKPTMMNYLKLMKGGSGDNVIDDGEKQLSLVEKMVMDACDIAEALDASKDDPNVNILGWSISKVYVFLLDSKKKNCFLQFGAMAEGIWSLVEKDVDFSDHRSEDNMDSDLPSNKKRKVFRKASKDDPCIDESTLKKLAYAAVKHATGITEDCLKVLECHASYSISKAKAAACLYIIQCTQSDRDGLFQVPIEDTLNSMLGPLVMRSSGLWTHTSVVEYYHLLPYHKLLQDWLSRKVPYSSFSIKNFAAPIVKTDILCGLKASSDSTCLEKKTSFGSPNRHEQCGNGMDVASPSQNGAARKRLEYTHRGIGGFMVSSSVGKNQHSSLLPYARHSSHHLTQPTELVARPPISEFQDHNSSYQNGRPPTTYHSKGLDKVLDIVASKGREISQAAHRILLSKRDKLSLQHRELEYKIAECDRDIEAVLSGKEDCLATQIQSILEVCNDASFRSVLRGNAHGSVPDQSSHTAVSIEKDQDTDYHHQGPCQVLDDICSQNDWPLPTYRLKVQDGGFKAEVTFKGKTKQSAEGTKQKDPVTAAESAAEKMLITLHQNNGTVAPTLPLGYR